MPTPNNDWAVGLRYSMRPSASVVTTASLIAPKVVSARSFSVCKASITRRRTRSGRTRKVKNTRKPKPTPISTEIPIFTSVERNDTSYSRNPVTRSASCSSKLRCTTGVSGASPASATSIRSRSKTCSRSKRSSSGRRSRASRTRFSVSIQVSGRETINASTAITFILPLNSRSSLKSRYTALP